MNTTKDSNIDNNNNDNTDKNQLEKSIDKHLKKGNCNKNKIPLNQVIDQVIAFNGKIKADDPKFIFNNDTNAFLSKKLPQSIYIVKSNLIHDKFKEYQNLLKKMEIESKSNSNNNNIKKLEQSFIQIRKLEKYFKEENYKPYLNLLELKKNKKNFLRKV